MLLFIQFEYFKRFLDMISNLFFFTQIFFILYILYIFILNFLFIKKDICNSFIIQFISTSGNAIVKPPLSILFEALQCILVFSKLSTSQLKRNYQNESKPKTQQLFFTTLYIKTSIGCKTLDYGGNQTQKESNKPDCS